MSKRFTDTEKWRKPFIRALNTSYKLLWLYLLDDCDISGVWQVDFEIATIKLGTKLDQKEALSAFKDKITVLAEDKWLINDFVPFQYGKLQSSNRMHVAILRMIRDHQLTEISPLQGAKDKDKDTDKGKDKEGVVGGVKFSKADLPDWLKGDKQNGQPNE